MTSLRLIGLCGLLLVSSVGCGSSNFSVYPVTGTVTYNGQPMQGGGSIAFIPAEGQDGKAAGGTIDEDGTYTLTTYTEGDGSIPGKFKVLITQSTADEPEATPDGQAPREPIQHLSRDAIIPPVYGDFNASPLSATVEEQPNELNFDLSSDVGVPPVQRGA